MLDWVIIQFFIQIEGLFEGLIRELNTPPNGFNLGHFAPANFFNLEKKLKDGCHSINHHIQKQVNPALAFEYPHQHTKMSTTTVKLTLTAEQVEMLKLVLGQVVKPSAGAGKGPKVKRIGSAPKGVTPPHLIKWNSYVDSVEAELKTADIDDVWEQWVATNPVNKEGVSKATDEARAKFKVIRKIAMAIAKARKESGLMPAEFQHTPMTDEEKAAAKAARKAAKAAAGESGTESTEESSAEEPAKKPRKPRAVKPKVAAVPVPVAPPAPAPAVTEDDDDEFEGVALESWSFKGRKYLRTSDGDCWIQNADGGRGKWAGHFDGSKIDASATEPETEE